MHFYQSHYVCMCLWMCAYTYMYACAHVYVHMCACMGMRICMCVCMFVHTVLILKDKVFHRTLIAINNLIYLESKSSWLRGINNYILAVGELLPRTRES